MIGRQGSLTYVWAERRSDAARPALPTGLQFQGGLSQRSVGAGLASSRADATERPSLP